MAGQLKHLKDELAEPKGSTPNKSSKEMCEHVNYNYLKCEHCDYICIKKPKMIKHINTKQCHLKCKVCGKDFKSLNELEFHVMNGHIQSNSKSIFSSTQMDHDDT